MKSFTAQLTETAKSVAVQLVCTEQPLYVQSADWRMVRSIHLEKQVLQKP
ncbi:MAG: hypothetical protein AB1757_20990 [Acidobacteriota bacterium]